MSSLVVTAGPILASFESDPGEPRAITQDQILDRFLGYLKAKNVALYPAQEEAILELMEGKNLILNTPTGSGKSLVALALHFESWVHKRRSYYTSPIKALVNEKFFDLCRVFGPAHVGMITGDATVNAEAPIICCTAEILSMKALREGALASVHDVVMDEFHYYSDRERGVAWQIPLLALPQTRFLLMSATMGNSETFAQKLTQLNQRETVVVQSSDRPVPLEFHYSEVPLHETVLDLVGRGRAPIYLVSFTQRECAEQAQNFMSLDLCTKEEKRSLAEALSGFRFSSPYGRELQRFLRHGMGLHHAGLLPKYRILVEKLAQKGLLKIIFGTDTLGVGVNVPLRTVLFTQLCKFDGTKAALLTVRDFHQIAGRAGRKGFDDLGTVVAQAPEHVIENKRNELKAAGDPKKLKKLVRKKPPERGFVPWSQETFQKLISSQAEPLESRFTVSHSMLLNVLSRPHEDGCSAMRSLIRASHETRERKKKIFSQGFQFFRSLVDRQIIELNPLRINVDLQEDFSLNHGLSLYLVDVLRLLDPQSPDYGLEVLTLTESILESPDLILRKQLDRLKTEKMRELKAAGVEYEERMEELEKLEHPKPMREFVYTTFNEFARIHPWIGEENIRPKSIAREMIEGFFSFGDYIKEYGLQRGEGLLLRYLSEVYKALAQNVPSFAKTDTVDEITLYFRTLLRQVDSSLIDEWEQLQRPSATSVQQGVGGTTSTAEEWDRKALITMIKNQGFRILKDLIQGEFEEVVSALQGHTEEPSNRLMAEEKGLEGAGSRGAEGNEAQSSEADASEAGASKSPPVSESGEDLTMWTPSDLEKLMQTYFDEGFGKPRLDFKARTSEALKLDMSRGNPWILEQHLVDGEGLTGWTLRLGIDVPKSKKLQRPVFCRFAFEKIE